MLKTNKDILKYIHDNLGPIIRKVTDVTFADTPYTESLLAGMTCRETGFLFPKYVNKGYTLEQLAKKMIGDRGHGYGFIQIDDRSYKHWLDTVKLTEIEKFYEQAVRVLLEKAASLRGYGWTPEKMGDDAFLMATVCAYNCGQGNVNKALRRGLDPNHYTFTQDYGKEVMRFRYIYYDNFVVEEDLDLNIDIVPAEALASVELEPIENFSMLEAA